jgi:hypothetical protein
MSCCGPDLAEALSVRLLPTGMRKSVLCPVTETLPSSGSIILLPPSVSSLIGRRGPGRDANRGRRAASLVRVCSTEIDPAGVPAPFRGRRGVGRGHRRADPPRRFLRDGADLLVPWGEDTFAIASQPVVWYPRPRVVSE